MMEGLIRGAWGLKLGKAYTSPTDSKPAVSEAAKCQAIPAYGCIYTLLFLGVSCIDTSDVISADWVLGHPGRRMTCRASSPACSVADVCSRQV